MDEVALEAWIKKSTQASGVTIRVQGPMISRIAGHLQKAPYHKKAG